MKNKTGFMLLLVALVCMAGARANAKNPADWSFSVETSGEDVSWTSTTRVYQAFPAYDFVYDLNQVEVDVVGTGWTDYSSEFGSTTGEGASYEGLPMGLMSYNHDVNGLTASIQISIDGQGYAHLSVTNVVFGQWGGQDIDGLRIGGTITVVGLKELWADDFCYGVVDGWLGDTASWTEPDTTTGRFKIGGTYDGRVYYNNNTHADSPRLAMVDGVGSLYDPNSFRIKAEGYIRDDTDPNTNCQWFVLGRISGPNHVRVGAVIDTNTTPERLYMRVADTGGYADGDYYVGVHNPTQPFIIELIFDVNDVNTVKGRVSHLGRSASASFTTTVTAPGAPGLAGYNEWGYATGYFDNFAIYTNSAVNPAQCGDQGTVYPDADLNEDCRIDFEDFAKLASNWLLSGAAQAEVLFEDNFDSYDDDINNVPDAVYIGDPNNNIWVGTLESASGGVWSVPWGTGPLGSDVKVGTIAPNKCYFSNNTYLSPPQIAKVVDVNANRADYTIEAEAWRKLPDPIKPNLIKLDWYIVGRITDVHVRLGAALSLPDANGNQYVYGRIVDSVGYATRCNWVADYDPNAPIYLKLTLNGDTAAGTIAHNGGTQTISIITDVLNAGAPGVAGYNQWGYAVGYFDNFKVSVPTCGDPGIAYNAGDVNQDCHVDMLDVEEFVTKWLECTDPADAGCDQYWK